MPRRARDPADPTVGVLERLAEVEPEARRLEESSAERRLLTERVPCPGGGGLPPANAHGSSLAFPPVPTRWPSRSPRPSLNWSESGCSPQALQSVPASFLHISGTTVSAQMWSRDSVATGQVLSNGVTWVVGP